MPVIKFTKAKIDKLALPDKGQAYYYDDVVQGFGLCVSAGGTKTYFAEGRLHGKKRRITIGRHGKFVPDTARPRAQELLVEMAKGVDHNAVKSEQRARATTLGAAFEQFKEARHLRPRTLQVYNSAMQCCFKDWMDKPITEISKDMVEQRYKKLLENGWVAQSHLAMRTLRAILNFAGAVYEDTDGKSILPENPVKRLSQAKLWRPLATRQTIIQPTRLKAWYKAVKTLKNTAVRDYLLLCLFTGLRRNEATRLKWSDIDFEEKTLRIPPENSKNHLEHQLPLSTFLVALLDERSKVRKIDNSYVFPGDGATGHLVEPKRNTQKVATDSKISFTIHDMRRTFLTIAEMLDVPHYALKKLANHKSTDITGRYIQADTERLREPMQKITNFIVAKAGIKIADIRRTRKAKVAAMAGR